MRPGLDEGGWEKEIIGWDGEEEEMEEEKEKGWRRSLDLSSTEEEKKMEGWTDKGLEK